PYGARLLVDDGDMVINSKTSRVGSLYYTDYHREVR
ncbi:putative dNA-directed RNA polymerase subunit beta', partial [Rickettsia amblyommatis str. Darkwater]